LRRAIHSQERIHRHQCADDERREQRRVMDGQPSRFPDRYAAADVARALPGRVATTVIHGDQDRQVPVAMSRALRGVALVELVGVGHFELIDPFSAAWPAVLSAVRQSEQSGPGSSDPIG